MNVVESHRLSVSSVGQSIPCRCKLGICATNCFLEFQEVLRCNEAHNFRTGWVHDRDADTRPWITDTCAASMALKASSSIFIKCHILPKLTLLTSWIVDDLPRQRNLKDHQPLLIDLTPVPTPPLTEISKRGTMLSEHCLRKKLEQGYPHQPLIELVGRRRRRQQSKLICC